MIEFIHDSWHGVMNHKRNPLRHIPDQNVRHLVLQLLAWMWCIAFSLYFSSWYLFGITVISHFVFIIAIFITVMTFSMVTPKPQPEEYGEDDMDPITEDDDDYY